VSRPPEAQGWHEKATTIHGGKPHPFLRSRQLRSSTVEERSDHSHQSHGRAGAAQARAQRLVARVLTLAVLGYVGFDVVVAFSARANGRLAVLPVLASHVALVVVLLKVGRSRTQLRTWWVTSVAACSVATGVFGDATAPTHVAAGQSNVAWGALVAGVLVTAAYGSAGVTAALALSAAGGHGLGLLATPVQALQGAVLLLVMAAGWRYVVRLLLRFAADADAAAAEAAAAERRPAGALVHDGLSLMRLLLRQPEPPPRLTAAALAALAAQHAFLDGTGRSDRADRGTTRLAGALAAVAREFPDLPLQVHLSKLTADVDDPTSAAVSVAVRTLLTNVRVHARAATVRLHGSGYRDWSIAVLDDGCGFDAGSVVSRRGLTMFSRDVLADVGVEMEVASAIGAGTSVTIRPARDGGTAPAAAPSAADGGASAPDPPGRWAAPATSEAQARRLVHVGVGLLISALWLMITLGLGGVLTRFAHPLLSACLVCVVSAAWTGLWLYRETRRTTALAAALAVAGAVVGTLVTVFGGVAGTDAANPGVTVAAWSGELLAAQHPRLRPLAILAVWAPTPALAIRSPAAAVSVVAWTALGVYVMSALGQSLIDLGAEADAARARAVALERRAGHAAVARQAEALHHAVTGGADVLLRARLSEALERSERYLHPGSEAMRLRRAFRKGLAVVSNHEHRLELDFGGLEADPPGDTIGPLVNATVELVTASLSGGCARVRLRAHSCAGLWEVSVLSEVGDVGRMGGPALSGDARDALVATGVRVVVRLFPGGDWLVRLTAASRAQVGGNPPWSVPRLAARVKRQERTRRQ